MSSRGAAPSRASQLGQAEPETGEPMTIDEFENARSAVAEGTSIAEAARALVAAMTPEERLWCLDGDASDPGPDWRFLGARTATTRHRSRRRSSSGSACPASRSATVPRHGGGQRDVLPGVRWLAARPGTPTWRSGSATRSAASCAPRAPTLTGAVCVNVLRHPAWGRAQETYGEDPHHVGELGAAFTRGLQRHVMACVKHFACNSMENARFSVDIAVDEVALHEVYLAALPPHRRRRRRGGHVRLQLGQRRVVRPEPGAARPTSCATSGASTAS